MLLSARSIQRYVGAAVVDADAARPFLIGRQMHDPHRAIYKSRIDQAMNIFKNTHIGGWVPKGSENNEYNVKNWDAMVWDMTVPLDEQSCKFQKTMYNSDAIRSKQIVDGIVDRALSTFAPKGAVRKDVVFGENNASDEDLPDKIVVEYSPLFKYHHRNDSAADKRVANAIMEKYNNSETMRNALSIVSKIQRGVITTNEVLVDFLENSLGMVRKLDVFYCPFVLNEDCSPAKNAYAAGRSSTTSTPCMILKNEDGANRLRDAGWMVTSKVVAGVLFHLLPMDIQNLEMSRWVEGNLEFPNDEARAKMAKANPFEGMVSQFDFTNDRPNGFAKASRWFSIFESSLDAAGKQFVNPQAYGAPMALWQTLGGQGNPHEPIHAGSRFAPGGNPANLAAGISVKLHYPQPEFYGFPDAVLNEDFQHSVEMNEATGQMGQKMIWTISLYDGFPPESIKLGIRSKRSADEINGERGGPGKATKEGNIIAMPWNPTNGTFCIMAAEREWIGLKSVELWTAHKNAEFREAHFKLDGDVDLLASK